MVLGKLPVPGRPIILITVWQGPTGLPTGACWGCLEILLIYPFSSFSLSLVDGLIYTENCLKEPLNNYNQPTTAGSACVTPSDT